MQPSRYVAHTVVLNTREQETGLCLPFCQLHATKRSPSKSEPRPFMVLPLAWVPGTYDLRTWLISQMYKRRALQALRIRGRCPCGLHAPRLLLQRRVSKISMETAAAWQEVCWGTRHCPNPFLLIPHACSQFWYYLSGESITFHGLRAWSYRTVLPNFKCQMEVEVVTCVSDQPAIGWRSLQSLLWVQFIF